MPKGTKWKLTMSIKADREMPVTTSAQGQPRQYKGGFINEFTVGTEWKDYTWSGEIGVDDFQSIAFDLNNSDERNADDNGWTPGNGNCGFYFDNIEFGYDLGSANPASEISAAYGADVIEINLNDKTNMKDLVKTGPKALLIALVGVFVPLAGGTLVYSLFFGFSCTSSCLMWMAMRTMTSVTTRLLR